MTRGLSWITATALVGVWFAAQACMPDDESTLVRTPTSSSGSGGSGGESATGGGTPADDARASFATLLPSFIDECGGCHVIGGAADTPFLGDPDKGTPRSVRSSHELAWHHRGRSRSEFAAGLYRSRNRHAFRPRAQSSASCRSCRLAGARSQSC